MAAAKAIADDPVHAITNVPKGVMKFMGRIGENVKGISQMREGKDPEARSYNRSSVTPTRNGKFRSVSESMLTAQTPCYNTSWMKSRGLPLRAAPLLRWQPCRSAARLETRNR
jgi:hypothetical protein